MRPSTPAPAYDPVELPAKIARQETRSETGSSRREFVLTETMRPGDSATDVFRRLAAALRERGGVMLGLMIYGAVNETASIRSVMKRELGPGDWPVTWVEGASCTGQPLAGVQAFALSGGTVTRIRLGRLVAGSVFTDGEARHCLLGGLSPAALSLQPAAQVQQIFGLIDHAFQIAGGFELADVVRTWFYNDDILPWYDDFNRVRTGLYAGLHWRSGSLPASTGIGARNAQGAAAQVALWAVRPEVPGVNAREIASPLQCPAPAYGSSFSRAMEVASGGLRRLFVSGTASIHPDGRTAWAGDARRQVDLTMEVVAAILQSRGMTFADITRATAYYRHAADCRYFAAWQRERELEGLPVVNTHSVVCRDDLLFEIEVDACLRLA